MMSYAMIQTTLLPLSTFDEVLEIGCQNDLYER